MTGSSSEVLREYLISLGFKTDSISLSKFTSGIGAVGTRMLKVGGAVAAVVGAVESATAAFAYSMRKVYFTAELSNTSVKNLKSLQFASKQVGVSSESMASALENAGAMMRNFSKSTEFTGLTGIRTEGKKANEVLIDFLKYSKKFETDNPLVGHQIASGWAAQFFGLSEGEYTLTINHLDELIKKQNEAIEYGKQIGYDPDLPANKAAILSYTAAIDSLSLRLSILGQSILVNFVSPFNKSVTAMSHVIDGWTLLTNAIGKGGFEEADKKNAASQWGRLKDSASQTGKHAVENLIRAVPGLDNYKFSDNHPSSSTKSSSTNISPPGKTKTTGSAYDLLRAQGWSDVHATGIVANLQAESGLNPASKGDFNKQSGKYEAYGIGQWHADRQADFKKIYGKDIRGSSLTEQLKFLTYEMRRGKEKSAGRKLLATNTYSEAGQAVSRFYERPGDIEGQTNYRGRLAAKLGASGGANSVSVVQNNEINVGGSNAHGVASAIRQEQTRTMGDALRITKTAYQ